MSPGPLLAALGLVAIRAVAARSEKRKREAEKRSPEPSPELRAEVVRLGEAIDAAFREGGCFALPPELVSKTRGLLGLQPTGIYDLEAASKLAEYFDRAPPGCPPLDLDGVSRWIEAREKEAVR